MYLDSLYAHVCIYGRMIEDMPRLSAIAKPETKIEFVLSTPLDLMNAMYFTALAERSEGIDGWPAQVRREMDASLRKEMDFLYSYPTEGLGVMGQFGDHLWGHPETWGDVDSLLRYLDEMPRGAGEPPLNPGIQGLVLQASTYGHGRTDEERRDAKEGLREAGLDSKKMLAVFDDPEGLRKRMRSLIERFYEEHYKPDLPRRLPLLERSYEAHRRKTHMDPEELLKQLSGRQTVCIGSVCSGRYEKSYFAPSLDMGPYMSCADLGPIHGLFYPCDVDANGEGEAETLRLARVYKALGDEQRLRILRMLRGRELMIQEIAERTGLHQSVVSRHLSFMHAVGLLTKRKEGSARYISINPKMQETLSRTLDLFAAPPGAGR